MVAKTATENCINIENSKWVSERFMCKPLPQLDVPGRTATQVTQQRHHNSVTGQFPWWSWNNNDYDVWTLTQWYQINSLNVTAVLTKVSSHPHRRLNLGRWFFWDWRCSCCPLATQQNQCCAIATVSCDQVRVSFTTSVTVKTAETW